MERVIVAYQKVLYAMKILNILIAILGPVYVVKQEANLKKGMDQVKDHVDFRLINAKQVEDVWNVYTPVNAKA